MTVKVGNVDQCNGCRMCEMVCSFAHGNEFDPTKSRIRIVKVETKGIDIPIIDAVCDLCEAVGYPQCVKYCPTLVLQYVERRPEEAHILDRIRREIERSSAAI